MNLTGKGPTQKPAKVAPDEAYLDDVRALPCVCCGQTGVEAHHCKDMPPKAEQGIYTRLPGAALKSGDWDAIPLCPPHHRMYHLERRIFHKYFGKDYSFIARTRRLIEQGEHET